jgi:selenide,water dikinase
MCKTNRVGALCLRDFGASSCTDVTGFGLLGHLVEMMKASGVGCTLEMDDIPTLPGALECIRKGIFSSLQPQNLKMKRTIINPEEAQAHEVFPLLFDPQTAGGLLATVPFDQADQCVEELIALGYEQTVVIGVVGDHAPERERWVTCRV